MNLAGTRCSGQEGKRLLLKKKKQKDFAHAVQGARAAPEPTGQKFLGSPFQERTRFFLVTAQTIEAGRLVTSSGGQRMFVALQNCRMAIFER